MKFVCVHVGTAKVLLIQKPSFGGALITKNAVSIPSYLHGVFNVELEDFAWAGLHKLDLLIERKRRGNIFVDRDNRLIIHNTCCDWHPLGVVFRNSLSGCTNHLQCLVFLHLGNYDSIFPVVSFLVQRRVAERAASNLLPLRPIRPLEPPRVHGILLNIKMRDRQNLVVTVCDIQSELPRAVRAAIKAVAILILQHAAIWRDVTNTMAGQRY
mmetsp:Transcript_63051/g.117986  ORF Transcript_63051/g.117986 Transcript_63051/m.117986 type:complete len:212 (+) Transcript_63051:172-807(+)